MVACLYPDFLAGRSMEQAYELAFFDSDLSTVKYGVSFCGPSGFWKGTKYVSVGLSSFSSSWDKTDQVRYDIYQGLSAGTDPAGPDVPNPNPGSGAGSGADSNGGSGSDSGANGAAPSVSAKTGDSAVELVAVLAALCSATVAVAAKKRRRTTHK